MRIPKDVEYALICLLSMGQNKRLFSARELSDLNQVPYGLVCKILQRLANGEIIDSQQGPKGGYLMNRSADDITLGEIFSAVHGERHVAACLDNEDECIKVDSCKIRGGILRVQDNWDRLVNRMSLSEFADGVA